MLELSDLNLKTEVFTEIVNPAVIIITLKNHIVTVLPHVNYL